MRVYSVYQEFYKWVKNQFGYSELLNLDRELILDIPQHSLSTLYLHTARHLSILLRPVLLRCKLANYLCGLKPLLDGVLIYIKLGILSLCSEPWTDTRCMSISWYLCLDTQAFWWIDDVYRYWLSLHTHLSTTFNLTLNCPLILTHARRSDQYCRA